MYPNICGKFGDFGGIFAPEVLMPALTELAEAFDKYRNDDSFKNEYYQIQTADIGSFQLGRGV